MARTTEELKIMFNDEINRGCRIAEKLTIAEHENRKYDKQNMWNNIKGELLDILIKVKKEN